MSPCILAALLYCLATVEGSGIAFFGWLLWGGPALVAFYSAVLPMASWAGFAPVLLAMDAWLWWRLEGYEHRVAAWLYVAVGYHGFVYLAAARADPSPWHIEQPPALFAATNLVRIATCDCGSIFAARRRSAWLGLLAGVVLPLCAAENMARPAAALDEVLIAFYTMLSVDCTASSGRGEAFVYQHLFALLCGAVDPGAWYTVHALAMQSGAVYMAASHYSQQRRCDACVA